MLPDDILLDVFAFYIKFYIQAHSSSMGVLQPSVTRAVSRLKDSEAG